MTTSLDPRDIELDIVRSAFLQTSPMDDPPVDYEGRVFHLIGGYRRGFHGHDIYMCGDTKEFAMHVWDNDMSSPWDGSTPPRFGIHASLTDLIRYVAESYSKAWTHTLRNGACFL